MLGHGESSPVLALISSIIVMLKRVQEVYEGTPEAKGLPENFRVAAEHIPLVLSILSLAEQNIREGKVNDEALRSVELVLEQCKDSVTNVKDIFENAAAGKDGSNSEGLADIDRLRRDMEGIVKNMDVLAQYHLFQDAEALRDIQEAITRLDITSQNQSEGSPGVQHEAQASQLSREDMECIKAFTSPIDCLAQKNRNEVCAPETGQWFFRHRLYQDFSLGDAPRLLFVTAEAGSGKSTVMRTLVDSLRESQPSLLTAHFFFKDDDDLQRSYTEALAAIIHQLLTQRPALVKHVREPVRQHGQSIKGQTAEMWKVLTNFAMDVQDDIVCIMDAVDECETSGRTQLLIDLKSHFQEANSAPSRLKIVVSSRPYQDRYHPYEDLISCSPQVYHLDGENAKFKADIENVISFKIQELTRRRQLSVHTAQRLSDKIVAKNAQTKSFLWVKLAFELLNADPKLLPDAVESTIDDILAAIPESIGEQFDRLLGSSSDPTHARNLLSVILAARRPLKVAELKVVYGLTRDLDGESHRPKAYEDLDMLQDDYRFKRLVRTTCGLFITFVKSSVHLFHQTAREYLMPDPKGGEGKLSSATSAKSLGSWKHSITPEQANCVTAKVCLDLLSFDVSEDWVWKVCRCFARGNFRGAVQKYSSNRPFQRYAACNWYEHLTMSGNYFNLDDYKRGRGAIFDISKPQFWVWFFTACDQVCLRNSITSAPWKDELVASVWADMDSFGDNDRGLFLRQMCLQKLFPTDIKIGALLFDEISFPATLNTVDGPVWTATDGYGFIDAFHLANGDMKHTSMSKAVLALEQENKSASQILLENISTPTLIWTSMRDGQPKAFSAALARTMGLEWLDGVPEYLLTYKGKQAGLIHCPESALQAQSVAQQERNEQYHAAFEMMIKANTLKSSDLLFGALADWVEGSPSCQAAAERIWKAGGFINPLLSRRLVGCGAPLDCQFWRDNVTALHVAATFWEHDALESLLDMGADALVSSANGYNALHWFCLAEGGPMKEKEAKLFRHRYKRLRIKTSLRRLTGSVVEKPKLLHQQDVNGITPLMLSVRASPSITRCLLEEGAYVDQLDGQNRTAVMHFFIGGQEWVQRPQSILKALLLAGADARLCDSEGVTAVGYWAREILSQELSNLYGGINAYNLSFHALDSCGDLAQANGMAESLKPFQIPLAVAAKLGNAQLCRYLLSAGASASEHGIDEQSPMARHSGTESSDLREMFWNPLMIAIRAKAYVTATLLLEAGADVHFQISKQNLESWSSDREGTTPLHLLMTEGKMAGYISKLSMATGGSVSGCSFEPVGHPDMEVSKKSVWERMAELSRRPPSEDLDHEVSDAEVETIRNVASNDWRGARLVPFDKVTGQRTGTPARDHEPLLEVIYDSNSNITQRQNAVMELMIRKGANVNARTVEGITPLFICAQNGRVDLARMLLHYGADAKTTATTGCTALMWAARRGDLDMAELLLNSGADADAQQSAPAPERGSCTKFEGRDGFSLHSCLAPVTSLALAAERGHYSVVKLLLDRKADPNLRIVHHVHGLLQAKDWERRYKHRRAQGKQGPEESDLDSDPEPEEWRGYWSVGTALTWARDEVRELLLQYGADPAVEEPIRECECDVPDYWVDDIAESSFSTLI